MKTSLNISNIEHKFVSIFEAELPRLRSQLERKLRNAADEEIASILARFGMAVHSNRGEAEIILTIETPDAQNTEVKS